MNRVIIRQELLCVVQISDYSMFSLLVMMAICRVVVVVSKTDVVGTDMFEGSHLPDEILDVEEMAEKADKKFHEASQRILRNVQKKRVSLERDSTNSSPMEEKFDTADFDRY